MLAGVARYLEVPGTRVLPIGLTGAETLFGIDDSTLHPARVTVRFGAAISADKLLSYANRDRRLVMDAIGVAIAELLPPEYCGVYSDANAFPDARRVLEQARAHEMLPPR